MNQFTGTHAYRLLLAATLLLTGCYNGFIIQSPAERQALHAPVATTITWDNSIQPNTLRIVLNPTSPDEMDITDRFTIGNGIATADLNFPLGCHELQVSGMLFEGSPPAYQFESTTRAFSVHPDTEALLNPITPVTYTMIIDSHYRMPFPEGLPAGTLNRVPFGGSLTDPVELTLTFDGDAENIVPYHVPTSNRVGHDGDGFENTTGTACFKVQEVTDAGPGDVLIRGMFLPEAGIFVSVGNGNGGIGFGSFGLSPSDPWFPGGIDVAYPYGMLGDNSKENPVDLKSVDTRIGDPDTCYPATGPCATLPTTVGVLAITPDDDFVRNMATFTVRFTPPY